MKYFSVLAVFIILFLSACSSSLYQSKWQSKKIIIDGDISDWSNEIYHLEDEKLSIGLTNDNKNIYLCLVTTDNQITNKILRNGLTIWFNPEESDGETIGVCYPIRKIESRKKVTTTKIEKTIDQVKKTLEETSKNI